MHKGYFIIFLCQHLLVLVFLIIDIPMSVMWYLTVRTSLKCEVLHLRWSSWLRGKGVWALLRPLFTIRVGRVTL